MQVRWSYEGLSYRHTEQETPDPECHTWQPPIDGAEFIYHAANLHLFRTGGPDVQLWSLERTAPREDQTVR